MTPKVSPGAEQGYVVNKRGQRIYTEVFLAPQGVKPSAVLCWEHGLGEHVGRYEKGALKRLRCSTTYGLPQNTCCPQQLVLILLAFQTCSVHAVC